MKASRLSLFILVLTVTFAFLQKPESSLSLFSNETKYNSQLFLSPVLSTATSNKSPFIDKTQTFTPDISIGLGALWAQVYFKDLLKNQSSASHLQNYPSLFLKLLNLRL